MSKNCAISFSLNLLIFSPKIGTRIIARNHDPVFPAQRVRGSPPTRSNIRGIPERKNGPGRTRKRVRNFPGLRAWPGGKAVDRVAWASDLRWQRHLTHARESPSPHRDAPDTGGTPMLHFPAARPPPKKCFAHDSIGPDIHPDFPPKGRVRPVSSSEPSGQFPPSLARNGSSPDTGCIRASIHAKHGNGAREMCENRGACTDGPALPVGEFHPHPNSFISRSFARHPIPPPSADSDRTPDRDRISGWYK